MPIAPPDLAGVISIGIGVTLVVYFLKRIFKGPESTQDENGQKG